MFIKSNRFSVYVHHFTSDELTKKNVSFVYSIKQKKAFQELKYALTHGLVLKIPNL